MFGDRRDKVNKIGLLQIYKRKHKMKMTLSKKQWESIGKKAGWLKLSQNMTDRMEQFFSPSIRLVRRTLNGKTIPGYWYVDLNKDYRLAKQFIEEAGINNKYTGVKIADEDLDAFGSAAAKHGYSVETIGE